MKLPLPYFVSSSGAFRHRYCGVGPQCASTCGRFELVGIIAGAVAAAVVVWTIVRVFCRQRTQRKLHVKRRREATMNLLQGYCADSDLSEAVLPSDCIDFSPSSEVIAVGGGGQIFKCTITSAISQRTTLKQARNMFHHACLETFVRESCITYEWCAVHVCICLLFVVQPVALKEVFTMMIMAHSHEGVSEFAKELAILLKLRHRHVVQVRVGASDVQLKLLLFGNIAFRARSE